MTGFPGMPKMDGGVVEAGKRLVQMLVELVELQREEVAILRRIDERLLVIEREAQRRDMQAHDEIVAVGE